MTRSKALIPQQPIEKSILLIRGKRVLLDADVAKLYGVPTKRLNEQVKRNGGRFPEDFMFQVTKEEATVLWSQDATSKKGRGGRRNVPYAFTEHGAIMAASVLNSERAIEVSVYVVRAFVKLRENLASHQQLARKISVLENKYDQQFKVVFDALRQLITPPAKSKKPIGFKR